MNRFLMVGVLVAALAATACGDADDDGGSAENNGVNNGANNGTNNGTNNGNNGVNNGVNNGANNGPANNGPANNGPANNGPANNGPANNGPANNGPANNGPANNGANNGPANNGPANNGANNGSMGFADVFQTVFVDQSCTNGYCHGGGAGGFQTQTEEDTWLALVEAPATVTGCDLTLRVVPGEPEQSILWHRLRPSSMDEGEPCFPKMPQGSDGLDEETAQLLYDWIAAGAM